MRGGKRGEKRGEKRGGKGRRSGECREPHSQAGLMSEVGKPAPKNKKPKNKNRKKGGLSILFPTLIFPCRG